MSKYSEERQRIIAAMIGAVRSQDSRHYTGTNRVDNLNLKEPTPNDRPATRQNGTVDFSINAEYVTKLWNRPPLQHNGQPADPQSARFDLLGLPCLPETISLQANTNPIAAARWDKSLRTCTLGDRDGGLVAELTAS